MSSTYSLTYPELQDRASEQDGEHLSIETLDAYHRGALREDEMSQIRRHLVLCRECSETLLDLVQFLRSAKKPSRLWSAELTAAWEEWLARLEQSESAKSSDRELVTEQA
jgi:hypothetical protein